MRTTAEGWLKGKFKFKENLLTVYHNNRFKQVETPRLICKAARQYFKLSPECDLYVELSFSFCLVMYFD